MAGGLLSAALNPLEMPTALGELLSHVPGSPLKPLFGLRDIAQGKTSWRDQLLRTPLQRGRDDRMDTVAFLEQLIGGLCAPYERSIEAGKPGEAIGRGIFDVGSMFFGAGELRGASAADDVARAAGTLDDVALGAVKREGALVSSLERLRPLLSEKAQEALAQQERLLPPGVMGQIEGAFRGADGAFDVEKANRFLESKWMEEPVFQLRLAALEARATQEADRAIKKARDICDETDSTNRPGATLGQGTAAEALLEEIRTGLPYKAPQGHYIKAAISIKGLSTAIQELSELLRTITSPAKVAEIQAVMGFSTKRRESLRNALDRWNKRAIAEPTVWDQDGMSQVKPGWPADPSPK